MEFSYTTTKPIIYITFRSPKPVTIEYEYIVNNNDKSYRQVSSIHNSCREQPKPKETSFIQDFEAKPRKARRLGIVYELSPQVLPIYSTNELSRPRKNRRRCFGFRICHRWCLCFLCLLLFCLLLAASLAILLAFIISRNTKTAASNTIQTLVSSNQSTSLATEIQSTVALTQSTIVESQMTNVTIDSTLTQIPITAVTAAETIAILTESSTAQSQMIYPTTDMTTSIDSVTSAVESNTTTTRIQSTNVTDSAITTSVTSDVTTTNLTTKQNLITSEIQTTTTMTTSITAITNITAGTTVTSTNITTTVTTTVTTQTTSSCPPSGITTLSTYSGTINAWTNYQFNYTATKTTPTLLFSTTSTNRVFYLDSVSVVDTLNTSVELLQNAGFDNSSSTLLGWNMWCSATCSGSGGSLVTGVCLSGNCIQDGCSGGNDYILQTFSTSIGHIYTISFWLRRSGSGLASGSFSIGIF